MMNLVDLQDKLKNLSEQQLIQEMQMPSGQLPQFLILSEITRRQRVRDDYAMAQGREQSTVAQDAIAAAGVPQAAAQQAAGTMAPQTDLAGNSGAVPQAPMPVSQQPVMGMAGGGIVALQEGSVGRGALSGRPQLTVINGVPHARMPDGSLIPMSQLGYGGETPEDALPLPVEVMGGPVNPSYREDQMRFDDNLRPVDPLFTPGLHGPNMIGPMEAPGRQPIRIGEVDGFPQPGSLPTVLGASDATLPAAPPTATGALRDWLASNPMLEGVGGALGGLLGPGGEYMEPRPEDRRVFQPHRGPLGSGEPLTDEEVLQQIAAGVLSPEDAAAVRAGALEAMQLPMDTGTPLEIPADPSELLPPSPETPIAPGGGAGVGGVGVGTGAAQEGALSPFQQELRDMLEAREKRAEQDRWLALAQFGAALMASREPTLGGAIGEAGVPAIQTLREGREAADADRLGILSMIEQNRMQEAQMQLQRQAAAARAAAGAAGDMVDPFAFGVTSQEKNQLELFAEMAQSPSPEMRLRGEEGYRELVQRIQARSGMGASSAPMFDLRS